MRDVVLDAESVRALLHTKHMGSMLHFLHLTDSTQAVAQRMALEAEPGKRIEGLLVFADEQTAGKGRHDHTWESPPGVNLYLSLVFQPRWPLARAIEIQFLSAVAAAQTLKKVCGLSVDLKWPNDLWCKRKKLGGIILTSHAADPKKIDFVVMGMGLNVNVDPKTFHPVVQKLATSVAKETGKPVDRAKLLAALLEEIESLYQEHQEEGFSATREKWQTLALQAGGKPVEIVDALALPGNETLKSIRGKAYGINDQGHLIVENAQGKRLAVADGTII